MRAQKAERVGIGIRKLVDSLILFSHWIVRREGREDATESVGKSSDFMTNT